MSSIAPDFRQDVRYGLKMFRRHPNFTVAAVLTLALGIGATSAIFSVLDAVVLRPLPFPEPDRLVWIQEVHRLDGRVRSPSALTSRVWRDESATIQGADAVGGILEVSLPSPAGAERIGLAEVGLNTLAALGVQPVLGRWFMPDEGLVEGDTAESLVISHGLWQRQFGGDPNVIGQSLPGWDANWGRVIIGVMPPGFWIHPSMADADGWYAFDYSRISGARTSALARVQPGVTFAEAEAELTAISRRIESAEAGTTPQDWEVRLTPLDDVLTGGYADTLYLLLGAVAFVLLIASVNVANLQLSRAAARQSEIATRVALGAGRWRLVRQLVSENVLLALAGGVLGLGVAYVGIWTFVTLAPAFYPPAEEITISVSVLSFTFAVSVLTGILSGLAPAFRASRPDLHDSLKQTTRGAIGGPRQGVRRVLVVVEVALALVLLVGAGLMINSYARVTAVDMGFDTDNLLTMELSLAGLERYRTRHDARHFSVTPQASDFYQDVAERVAALPGVESVGLTTGLPPRLWMSPPFRVIAGSGREDNNRSAQFHEVNEDYFETMGIDLIRGRMFSASDSESGSGVVIINETLARQYFGAEDPMGQQVQVSINQGNPELEDDRPREIVGIVRDARMVLRSDPMPIMYIPYRQHLGDYAGSGPFFIHARKDYVIRTASDDPMAMANAVRAAVRDADLSVAVDNMMSMDERLSASAGNERFWMRLLGLFAALAVFLATIGIYGVVSFTVEQRTHEFGIRTALGARKADILALVLREGFLVTAIGLVIGIAGAFGLTRLITNQLYGVTPMDPATITAVATVLVIVSMLACLIPGRRAAKIDPLRALRSE
jgi:putative ABC transport system permease protein